MYLLSLGSVEEHMDSSMSAPNTARVFKKYGSELLSVANVPDRLTWRYHVTPTCGLDSKCFRLDPHGPRAA